MKIFTSFFCRLSLLVLTLGFSFNVAFAQAPVTYQGKLENNGEPVTATKNMTFSVAGTSFTQTQSVNIEDGLYAVVLNFTNEQALAVANASSPQLTVTINGENVTFNEPITSSLIAAVSNIAKNAQQLNGQNADFYLDNTDAQTLTLTGSNLTISGVTGAGSSVTIPATNYTAGNGISISNNQITNTGDLNPSNELQTLALSGSNLTISGVTGAGSSVTIPATNYTAGTGLALNGTTFSVNQTTTNGWYIEENQANAITSAMITDGTITASDIATGVIPATANFVDVSSNQTIGGSKTFSSAINTSVGYNLNGSQLIKSVNNSLYFGLQNGTAQTNNWANTFIGNGCGTSNNGNYNTFIGSYVASNATGSQNTGIGAQTMNEITSGSENTVIGYEAGRQITTGSGNVLIGKDAGYYLGAGNENIFIGNYSMGSGTGSVALGASTSSGGNYNICIGYSSGGGGSNNIFIGKEAGNDNAGNGNIILGPYDCYNFGSDKLFIDNTNYINNPTPLIYGEFNNNLVRINGNLDVTGNVTKNGKAIDFDAMMQDYSNLQLKYDDLLKKYEELEKKVNQIIENQ